VIILTVTYEFAADDNTPLSFTILQLKLRYVMTSSINIMLFTSILPQVILLHKTANCIYVSK